LEIACPIAHVVLRTVVGMASPSWPKAKVGAAVAVAAVLVGGSAVAVATTGQRTAPAAASSEVSTTVPAAPSSTEPAATTTTSIPVVTSAATATQVVLQVGEAAAITLDWADGSLHVVSTVPSAGWTADDPVVLDATHVSVELRSATLEVHVGAELTPEGVVPTVTSEFLPVAGAPGGSAAPPVSGVPPTAAAPTASDPTTPAVTFDDDDHGDDYGDDHGEDHEDEDEDHEGEHHEDEHHEDEHHGEREAEDD
jgi:hypothetical protein